MAEPSKREMVLLGVLAALGCGALYIYLIKPMRADVEAADAQILELEQQVAMSAAVQAQLPEVQEELRQARERFRALQSVLPTSKETAEVVRRVQQLAIESNLHLKSFTPQQTIQNEFYEDWPILLSVEGTFDALGVFAEKVGAFSRIINIDNLTVRPVDVDSSNRSKTIAATCTATTYVFQEVSDDS